MTDETTRGYPLPHPDNIAREDATRIREAIQQINDDVEVIEDSLPGDATEAGTGKIQLATALEAADGASLTKVPAVKRVADMIVNAISELVGSAPAVLNTIEELADAIENDQTVIDALNVAVSSKASKSANLSDLDDAPTARANLGLAALAVKATIDAANLVGDGILTFAKLTAGAVATATEFLSNTASKLVAVQSLWSANAFVDLGNVSGTVTLDLNAGTNFEMTAVGNVTLDVINGKSGQSFGVFITQDATGGRTISVAGGWYPLGATAPTWTTVGGYKNYLSAQYHSTGQIVYAGGKIN